MAKFKKGDLVKIDLLKPKIGIIFEYAGQILSNNEKQNVYIVLCGIQKSFFNEQLLKHISEEEHTW